jgi:hypothetical protein
VGPTCRRRFPSPACPALSVPRARLSALRIVLSVPSLCRGPPVSSTFPVNHRGPARTHAENSGHIAYPLALASFEPRPHPLSPPSSFLLGHLSHALLPLPEIVRDPHPPCRPSNPLGAMPGLPDHRLEMRNSLSCSVSFISALPWLIRPRWSSVAPARCTRAVFGQIGHVLSPCFGP